MPFIGLIGLFLIFRIVSYVAIQSLIYPATTLDTMSADKDLRIRKSGAFYLLSLISCVLPGGLLLYKTLAVSFYIATPQMIALILALLFAVDFVWAIRRAVPLFEKVREQPGSVAPAEFRKFYETAVPLLIAEVIATLIFMTTL